MAWPSGHGNAGTKSAATLTGRNRWRRHSLSDGGKRQKHLNQPCMRGWLGDQRENRGCPKRSVAMLTGWCFSLSRWPANSLARPVNPERMGQLELPNQNRHDGHDLDGLGVGFKDGCARRMLVSKPPIRLVFSLIVMIGIRAARVRDTLMGNCSCIVMMMRQHIVTQQECVGQPEKRCYEGAKRHLTVKIGKERDKGNWATT